MQAAIAQRQSAIGARGNSGVVSNDHHARLCLAREIKQLIEDDGSGGGVKISGGFVG